MSEKVKILYVDDEYINLRLFEINLSKKYDVTIVDSGSKGLEVLAKNKDIKIVVSDMKMPKMNGIEFIEAAKKQHSTISYFILTGFEITDEIQKALDSGLIRKYFRKPFNPNEIHSEIDKTVI